MPPEQAVVRSTLFKRTMAQKIQIGAGSRPSARWCTPDAGELLFTTDNKRAFCRRRRDGGRVLVSGGRRSGYVQKLRGTQAIASGADSVAVTGLGLAARRRRCW